MATEKTSYNRKVKNKLFILLILMAVVFLLLIYRLFYISIINGETYASRASKQQTRASTILAQRGRLIDSNGIVLAQSGTSYRVLVNPQVIAEPERVRISLEVSDILGLDYDYVYERVCRVEKQQIVLKRQVESEVIDQLEALQLGGGISFEADVKRYFPLGKLFSQLIGFTGTEGEGQAGVEASYNSYLAGKNGRFVTEVDRSGNALVDGQEEYIPSTDGSDIHLTVDSVSGSYIEHVLSESYSAYKPEEVTAIVINPNTGEIIAASSYPTFDLNAPPRSDVTALLEMSRNYCVSEKIEPGSMFKLIVLAAALDSGVITPEETFRCTGSVRYGLESLYCTNTNGHGEQTIAEALQNDCDCVFMDIAQRMGKNTLYDYIYAFGFGEPTDCGIPGEDSGEVVHRKYIRDIDLGELSRGLNITATPIQMIRIYSALINGGILVQPYVVKDIRNTDGTVVKENVPTPIRRVISENTSSVMRSVMSACLGVPSLSAAQVVNYTSGGMASMSYKMVGTERSDTLYYSNFVQFLPVNNPQLCLFLMIEGPQIPAAYGRAIGAYCSGAMMSSLVNYYTIMPDNGGTDVRIVPDCSGMTMADAAELLNNEHFTTILLDSEADSTVVQQIPKPGTSLIRGSRVILLNSMTSYKVNENAFVEYVEVPNLVRQRRPEALDLCLAQGLVLVFDKSNCTGYITEQSIEPGTKVVKGTEIYVTFNGYYAASNLPTPTPLEPLETPSPEETIPGESPGPVTVE